jgi:hypothetical protein
VVERAVSQLAVVRERGVDRQHEDKNKGAVGQLYEQPLDRIEEQGDHDATAL